MQREREMVRLVYGPSAYSNFPQNCASVRGTDRNEGLRWANPFLSRTKVSTRARNFNSEKLKVNDLRGNPIEIAAAIVWRVSDTARASFDVENFESYVLTQAEAAVRHLASSYA